ncbi:MAG: 2OG-Fe(II) oxygenase, partial [Bacteroidia bacterium]|nr:2OG-Fe(II) oxygenase [Bacteroidia bacterium]
MNKQIIKSPFPHVIMENFHDTDSIQKIKKFAEELYYSRELDENTHLNSKKLALHDYSKFPLEERDLIREITNRAKKEVESFLGKPVLDDFDLNIGGGIHCLPEGGFLNMHIDFNIHPITGHERVANAILYLNENWNSDNGGNLVLWDGIKGGDQISYTPDFNRLVIFPVTEDSWHGNPDKVVNRDLRISLSMYFYDLEKSES